MKPGVIRKAPPKITITPSSTSRCGIRPAAIVSLNRRHTARPCDFSSSEPISESTARRRIVSGTPIASPTLKITYSSASGTTMNMKIRTSSGIRLRLPAG
jgi:hypothetical protein